MKGRSGGFRDHRRLYASRVMGDESTTVEPHSNSGQKLPTAGSCIDEDQNIDATNIEPKKQDHHWIPTSLLCITKGGVVMKITTRTVGNVRVLDCSGKITLGDGMLSLRNTMHDILQGGTNRIVLNLAHIKFIDSSGIGELVNTYNTVTNGGGQMRLLNVTKKISDPLVITQLLTVFKSYNDEQAALASFGESGLNQRIS